MPSPERKLTTILSADAAGYSRLMSVDEETTLATLKACHAVMHRLIAGHGGRVVSTTGDGLLAEFPSVVKAVECAIAVQREVAERNATLPENRRLWFRIGINLGDVIVEGGDLFGDGVNVAARLQALADPGGVLVTGHVHELVKDRLSVGFGYLGQKAVKNIPNEVAVYRVLLQPGEEDSAAPAVAEPPQREPMFHAGLQRGPLTVTAMRAGVLILLLFLINLFTSSGSWWFKWPALAILAWLALAAIREFQKNDRQADKKNIS
jgi:class 3 adenylate cyclase